MKYNKYGKKISKKDFGNQCETPVFLFDRTFYKMKKNDKNDLWNNISDLASNVILGQMENEIKNQADKAGKEMANLIGKKIEKNVAILLKQVGLKKKTPMDWVKDKMKGNNKIRK